MAKESTHRPAPELGNIYPETDMKATPALHSIIAAEIEKSGPMPFSRFMQMALYHPRAGYYSSRTQKTGKQGDFITSVSVGSCLGSILARRLHSYWTESESPDEFHIIEPGAHDGTLAGDILDEIARFSPEFYQTVHYHLIETSEVLGKRHSERLSVAHQEKFTSHSSISVIHSPYGAVISNELIDAFPVELIKFHNDHWNRQMVCMDADDRFCFSDTEIDSPEIEKFFASLGNGYPDGYTTEYNTGMDDYVRSAAGAISSGLFITIDYGHNQQDYYHPDRLTGTLQTYHSHQKAENPLHLPGEIDITAHVDFTRLQETAENVGFHSPWFGTQASYLTEHARSWLLEMESHPQKTDVEMIRQFQTLTHPSMLGTRFSVLEMRK